MSIDVKWEREGKTLIAILTGRIDSRNADHFQGILDAKINPEEHHLILDFEQVSFISSAGLRIGLLIARGYKKSESGNRFSICALSDPIQDVFSVSGFDRVISVYPSRTTAVNALENISVSEGIIPAEEKAQKISTIKSEIDFSVVGDNIRDIADLTIEKHEFSQDESLPSEVREEARAKINDVLWQRVEQLKAQRGQMLEGMFNVAELSLGRAVTTGKPGHSSPTDQGGEEELEDERIRSLRSEIDYEIVGDSVQDIAEFSVEKYEFMNDTSLSSDAREAAVAYIKEVLWQRIEGLKGRRNEILAEMFQVAEQTLDDALTE